jgi:hypothetical protein
MNNLLYRRSESNWIGSTGDSRHASTNYWRAQARQIFGKFPKVEVIEIVGTGRKTDSQILKRGSDTVPSECAVIIASTGGAWGKSRRDYLPA